MARRGHQQWYEWALQPRHLSPVARAMAGVSLKDIERLRESGRPPSSSLNTKLHNAYYVEQFGRLRRGGVNSTEARNVMRRPPSEVRSFIKDRRLHAEEMVLRHRAPLLKSRSTWDREVRKMLGHMGKKKYRQSEWAAFSEFYKNHPSAKRGSYFPKQRKEVRPPPREPELPVSAEIEIGRRRMETQYRKERGLPPKKYRKIKIERIRDLTKKPTGRRYPAIAGKPQTLLPKGKLPRVMSIRAKEALRGTKHGGDRSRTPTRVARPAVAVKSGGAKRHARARAVPRHAPAVPVRRRKRGPASSKAVAKTARKRTSARKKT